jgi:transitional endoplasmic reticulum ATPase
MSFIHSRQNQNKRSRAVEPIVVLWLLRILVPLECHRQFIHKNGFDREELARLLGLAVNTDEDEEPFNPQLARTQLIEIHEKAEENLAKIDLPQPLETNIQKLANQVGLTDVECGILAFAILIRSNRLLDDVGDWLGTNLNSLRFYYVLSVILGFSEDDIREALSAKSVLSKTSLVVLVRSASSLACKLDLLSSSFADRLMAEEGSPVDWLRDMVVPSIKPTISLTDYTHIQDSLDFLVPYLQQAKATERKGVNVFLYGSPGTGKTQLARVLAEHINCPLFEIASEDTDGDPIVGEQRLRAFRAAQAFFQHSQSMMLFDEVEDVFNDGNGFFGTKSTAQIRKAWMNRLLEENPLPTFWLGNTIQSIDPAFIRRFDWVIEVPVPPKAQREHIIRSSCGHVLTEQAIKHVAACEELAPAVITRAAGVIGTLTAQFPVERLSTALQQLMDKTLMAQGHPGLNKDSAVALPDFYDPELINCDANLKAIADGIQLHGSARICLFGPPGTGKSAYSRWLAEYLNKPLHIKRGADLLSKWVGGTEKNIASIFQEAEQDNAVLLIDEVDSFLLDRTHSQHSWEITGVNEMLTRMEAYRGVFIASTNRLEGLDSAALRRFDLKVKFDALKLEQAWKLLQNYCRALALPDPDESFQNRLKRLENLTPGDFAVLARQHRFRPITSTDCLITSLEAECALKTPYKSHPIGFI